MKSQSQDEYTRADVEANKEIGWYVEGDTVIQVITISPREVRVVGKLAGTGRITSGREADESKTPASSVNDESTVKVSTEPTGRGSSPESGQAVAATDLIVLGTDESRPGTITDPVVTGDHEAAYSIVAVLHADLLVASGETDNHRTEARATSAIKALIARQRREAVIENLKHVLNRVSKLPRHDTHPMGGYPVMYVADVDHLLVKMRQNADLARSKGEE